MIPIPGTPETFYAVNVTALMPFIKSNLSELIHISFGRATSTKTGSIQQCITYNPPGPSPAGATPDNCVCK